MARTPDYFKGKTIAITGAGSGIGRATAMIFAREGARVVCGDINEAGGQETAQLVTAAGRLGAPLLTQAGVSSDTAFRRFPIARSASLRS
ncbi:MAG: SDR family NAD(P)-dependent oxidoreductase [Betaproteobacteria bacterium]|nr:SDR family NAD(P)-dependent oxidoreductase [Betaproteobacteria bacterium]